MENKIISFIVVIAVVMAIIKRRGITNTIMSAAYNKQLTANFKLSELLKTDTGLPNIPNEVEITHLGQLAKNVLQPVRDLLGVPIGINSAFRSFEVNQKVGGVDNSQHRLGYAADIVPKGMDLFEAFVKIAKSKIPFDQLIIEKNKRGGRWIHISYNPIGGRKQLLEANWNHEKNKMDYKPITV